MKDIDHIKHLLNEAFTFERMDDARWLAAQGQAIAEAEGQMDEVEYFKGELELIEGRNISAITFFDNCIRLNPKHSEAFNDKALSLAELGFEEEALHVVEEALEFDPKYATLYHNKAWILARMGKTNEAIRWYKKALSLDPHSGATYSNLGEIFEAQANYKEALRWYREALSHLSPENVNVREWLADCIEGVKRKIKKGTTREDPLN
jgi:tetratricopeptide (TPR) repeat protein